MKPRVSAAVVYTLPPHRGRFQIPRDVAGCRRPGKPARAGSGTLLRCHHPDSDSDPIVCLGTGSGPGCLTSHVILAIVVRGKDCYSHFQDEKVEAQGDRVAGTGSPSERGRAGAAEHLLLS